MYYAQLAFMIVRQQRKMELRSFNNTNTAQKIAITLMTVAALVLLAWITAYWTWEWLAPRPEPRAQPVVNNMTSNMTAANDLFGNLVQQRDGHAATGIAIKLLGIIAASAGQRGYAVIQIKAGEILSVREGADIMPGIQLAQVHTDHVILERSGIRETLALPERNISTGSATLEIKK